jgi:hypothetical protein
MKNSFLDRLQARRYPGPLLTLVPTLVVQTVGTYAEHPAVLKDVLGEAKVELLEASVARPYVDDLKALLSRGSIVEQNPASAPSSSASR